MADQTKVHQQKEHRWNEQQFEAAKLWARGKTEREIKLQLHMDNINRSLKLFLPVADRARHMVRELQRVGYYRKKSPPPPGALLYEGKRRRAEEGYDVANRPPWPYRKNPKTGDLEQIPDRVERTLRVLSRIANEETAHKVALSEGLKEWQVYNMARDPRLWGYVRVPGWPGRPSKLVQGRHRPLVSEELARRAQQNIHRPALRTLRTWMVWSVGQQVPDPAKETEIRRVFAARRDRKSLPEIAAEFGLSFGEVRSILANEDFRVIVGEAAWGEAKSVVRVSRSERLRDQNKERVAARVRDGPNGARSLEIAQSLGLSQGSVAEHLGRLRRDKLVEKRGHYALWFWIGPGRSPERSTDEPTALSSVAWPMRLRLENETRILSFLLARNGEPTRSIEIAQTLSLTPAGATKLLQRLRGMGKVRQPAGRKSGWVLVGGTVSSESVFDPSSK